MIHNCSIELDSWVEIADTDLRVMGGFWEQFHKNGNEMERLLLMLEANIRKKQGF